MTAFPRVHSDQSKAKIGSTMRKLWEERLKHKRLREMCYLTWAAGIFEAAKRGGCGEEELEWDSYQKMKADIILQQLQWKVEKARAKESAKLKSMRIAEAKAAKMARLSKEKKEKEQKAKDRESKKDRKNLGDHKELSVFSRIKLRATKTKVNDFDSSRHEQLMVSASIGQNVNHVEPAIEKWDLEFIKKEKLRRSISFADQIRAAKNKKVEAQEEGFVA